MNATITNNIKTETIQLAQCPRCGNNEAEHKTRQTSHNGYPAEGYYYCVYCEECGYFEDGFIGKDV